MTDSISRTAAVLVDLNRQSLSSLHAMPIVNENFRNRYFENYLQNRKISIGSAKINKKSSSTNSNSDSNNINNNKDTNNKQNEANSNNKPNDTLTSLNTIYFKPNFNLEDNASSFDSDDEKSTGNLRQRNKKLLYSLQERNKFR